MTGGAATVRRIVVLGASGTVGRWACAHLCADGEELTTSDLAGEVSCRSDATAPDVALTDAVSAADMVVLALPEETALKALEWILGTAPAEAAVLTTCSVQEPVFRLAAEADARQTVLGVNPMFSPALPADGRPVALILQDGGGERAEEQAASAEERLAGGGMVVTRLDPATHDAATSYLQVLPHAALLAFADAMAGAPAGIPTLMRLAPPPARSMMALACRILDAPAEIYWDIQRANSHAAQRRRDLTGALDRLDGLVSTGTFPDFRAALAQHRDAAGGHFETATGECVRMFTGLTAPSGSTPSPSPTTGPSAPAQKDGDEE